MSYFCYTLSCDEIVRYIGITVNTERRLKGHLLNTKNGSNSHCCNWIRKILANGKHPVITVVAKAATKEFAGIIEIAFIEYYRTIGHSLTNMTAGGEGGSPSEEVRKIISSKLKGRKHTKEMRKKISDGVRKAFENPEIRGKLGKSRIGKKHAKKTCEKISTSNTGRVVSEVTKGLISNSHKGKKLTAEHRAEIGRSQIGLKRTDEQHAVMKAAQIAAHQKRLAALPEGQKLPRWTKKKKE